MTRSVCRVSATSASALRSVDAIARLRTKLERASTGIKESSGKHWSSTNS